MVKKMTQKAALISVSDKTGIDEFAKNLASLGYVILATGGSAKSLQAAGIKVVEIADYTGQPEILDGRVKTLHPKIHAGLLAKRSDPEHLKELEKNSIYDIDIACINLYPFISKRAGEDGKDYKKMIEFVDIGGPTMLRAAAKNFSSVYSIIDPADYARVYQMIKEKGSASAESLELRKELAVKVFTETANYDLQISKYFSGVNIADNIVPGINDFTPVNGVILRKAQDLRYGENPHQSAAYYSDVAAPLKIWKQLWGKELSYNNFLDFDSAAGLIRSLPLKKPTVAIIKHLNPCGVAVSESLGEAVKLAKKGDPRSHFGGIIALNLPVTVEAAEEIVSDFAEIVVAPDFDPAALEILKAKKNLRVISLPLKEDFCSETRSCAGGYLQQQSDTVISTASEAQIATNLKPTAAQLEDLELAWRICRHVKSNAIVLVKDGMLIGAGAGQTSRIDSIDLAIHKARLHGHDINGAVAASDAFFPFSDSIESLAKAGVKAIIAPKGAQRDEEVAETANTLGVSLLFTGDRHFRH
jgi:phosphoribosylaminoimidazolecarboxamide formyltransferase/IMP cyclohydrolase